MNTILLSEISRELPANIPHRLTAGGEPLLTAYGCLLLERDTGRGFVYQTVNIKTGRSEVLSRRRNPLTTQGVAAMLEKMRASSVAGAGRMEVDRPFGENLTYEKLREVQDAIFRDILPKYGYTVREKQIDLADHILCAIAGRRVTLAEAEVGTGKTHAYLIAAVLAKRGRANDFWNRGYYPAMTYIETAHMPIVISTSSIALQKAIIKDYIPELSKILMEYGVIKTPLTAVIRKGKEHYVCERNLLAHIPFENDKKVKQLLEYLTEPSVPIDLAEIDGLTPHVKRTICVPDRCPPECPQRPNCRYLRFLERAQSPMIDIQVCNHNYLLADAKRRAAGQKPLIPNYQILVIDEAHKFLQAARQMYGVELSSLSLPELLDDVYDLNFRRTEAQKEIRKLAKKLPDQSRRLFRRLDEDSGSDSSGDAAERFAAVIGEEVAHHLRKICGLSDALMTSLTAEPTTNKGTRKKAQMLWKLERVKDTAAAFAGHSELICWLEKSDDSALSAKLCAIPKNLDEKLYADLWSRGFPIILTSGTLSAGGDFTRVKETLGLDRMGIRLTETSKPSPFNYRDNALLYINNSMPFPDIRNMEYIDAAADEIERLLFVAHGHAVVLFTSYKALDMVYERMASHGLPFPLFRLNRKGMNTIETFKRSAGGVLLASGAMWEGVDIPGDALSLLVIVKLPFAVPDPIGDYEQRLYPDMDEYKRRVLVPDMLLKLKQGFGRLIRGESDTGVVAILDSRAAVAGAYCQRVLNALPDCRVTSDIGDVERFLREKKAVNYFE